VRFVLKSHLLSTNHIWVLTSTNQSLFNHRIQTAKSILRKMWYGKWAKTKIYMSWLCEEVSFGVSIKILWHFTRCRINSRGLMGLKFEWKSYTCHFFRVHMVDKGVSLGGRGTVIPVNVSSMICVNMMECNVGLSMCVAGIIFFSIKSLIKSRVAKFPSCIMNLSECQCVMMFLQVMFASNDREIRKGTEFLFQSPFAG
jgi:hypothetical protein